MFWSSDKKGHLWLGEGNDTLLTGLEYIGSGFWGLGWNGQG